MARGYSGQSAAYEQQQHQAGTYQPAAAYHQQTTEQQKPPIPIIRSDSKHNNDGSYEFQYETGNGILAGEQGYVKNGGHKDEEIQVAQGYFQYTGDDGIPISLKYVADENGFQPTVCVKFFLIVGVGFFFKCLYFDFLCLPGRPFADTSTIAEGDH